MPNNTRDTPYIDRIINEFIQKSKAFYPGLKFSRRWSMYNGDEPSSCDFEFSFGNRILNSTPYKIKSNTFLIHYVSDIQTLIEIVKTGNLRLTTLNSKNDKHELSYLSKELNISLTEQEIEAHKKQFFCASFSKIKNIDDENFSMWRLYGCEGKGAAIIFEVENYEDDWHHYTIGNVQYGPNRASERYRDYVNFFDDFQKSNNYPIQNRPITPNSFLALHKNIGWKYENEVRLLSYSKYDKYTLETDVNYQSEAKIFHSYRRDCGQYSYMELPLLGSTRFKEMEDVYLSEKMKDYYPTFKRMLPRIKICRIILGYQYSSSEFVDIETTIFNNAGKHPNFNIKMKGSIFSDH
jgi:hypothetical protein